MRRRKKQGSDAHARRRSEHDADHVKVPSSQTQHSSSIDPPGKMWGAPKRTNSMDTASLSSFSSEELSVQSPRLRCLSQAIADTPIGSRHYRNPPTQRCHPIACEIEGVTFNDVTRGRPSLWRQLYDNLSSEELNVEKEGKKEHEEAFDRRPSAGIKFFLGRSSDGDSRVSTERHPIGLAELLMSDSVEDLDDSEVEEYASNI